MTGPDVDADPFVDGRPPPPGCHWEWRPDRDWRTMPADEVRPCRYGAAPGHPACGTVAVAEMNRRRHNRDGVVDCWWSYCSRHTYGRRIRGGVVEHRVAVPNDPEVGQ